MERLAHIHAVATILPPLATLFPPPPPTNGVPLVVEERLHTSAALAAAALGSADSSGTCAFFPSVLPACGELIFVGAAALAFGD